MQNLKITPLTDFMGVDIANIDLSAPLGNNLKKKICLLLEERQLLLFRNQDISEDRYVDFSQIFSEPVPSIIPT